MTTHLIFQQSYNYCGSFSWKSKNEKKNNLTCTYVDVINMMFYIIYNLSCFQLALLIFFSFSNYIILSLIIIEFPRYHMTTNNVVYLTMLASVNNPNSLHFWLYVDVGENDDLLFILLQEQ